MPLFSIPLFDPTLGLLLLGVTLVASSTAIVGTFGLLQKRGLAGDAIAHAFLPGVCVAFLLTQQKAIAILTMGCFFSGGCALWLLLYLPKEPKIKRENSVALVLSIFLGLGLLLLSYIQHQSHGSQVGLQHFLLGSISSLMDEDLLFFGGLNVLVIGATYLLFRPWRLVLFDGEFARTTGEPVRALQFIFHLLTLLAIVMGVQTMGIILMGALLIAPPMAARFWTDRLDKMIGIAVFLSIAASVFGVWASYVLPQLPTGPCIALAVNMMALLSFLLAPKRGWLARYHRRHAYRAKVLEENILKTMYEMTQEQDGGKERCGREEIRTRLPRNRAQLDRRLKSLIAQGYIRQEKGTHLQLTEKGYAKGRTMKQLHLLWEAYLEHHLGIQADHVHDDAESMEHMIPPELEAELIKLVGERVRGR